MYPLLSLKTHHCKWSSKNQVEDGQQRNRSVMEYYRDVSTVQEGDAGFNRRASEGVKGSLSRDLAREEDVLQVSK